MCGVQSVNQKLTVQQLINFTSKVFVVEVYH